MLSRESTDHRFQFFLRENGMEPIRVEIDPAVSSVRGDVGERYCPFGIDILINLCLTITWNSQQDAAAQCDEEGHARPVD